MVSKEQLKAIEQAAYIGEKKRVEAEKATAREKMQKEKDLRLAEEAAERGIAKARGKPHVGSKTKKAGGFLLRVGKKVAQNIVESDQPKKRKSPMSNTITIDGKKYTLFKKTASKDVVERTKKQLKKNKKQVRTKNVGGTYYIYTR